MLAKLDNNSMTHVVLYSDTNESYNTEYLEWEDVRIIIERCTMVNDLHLHNMKINVKKEYYKNFREFKVDKFKLHMSSM